MTNLQLPDSNDSNLTAYNVDGLELFFTSNRKAYAHVTAIARMCEKSQGAVYSHVVNVLGKPGVLRAKVNVGNRFQSIDVFPSSVIVACLQKWNPSRLADFQDFGINEGLAQMAGVPLPQAILTPVPKSQEQQMIEMCENAIKMAKLSLAAEKYPGDQRDMLSILKGETALDGLMTTKEMADANGLALSKHQATQIGQIMSGHLRTKNETHPIATKRVKYCTASGNYQSYIANAYPASMMPRFLSAYAAVVGD